MCTYMRPAYFLLTLIKHHFTFAIQYAIKVYSTLNKNLAILEFLINFKDVLFSLAAYNIQQRDDIFNTIDEKER